MTNDSTIILSPEQISNIVSQITSNVSLSNTTITTNIISPMDFISMQNHIVSVSIGLLTISLAFFGFGLFSYFQYMINSKIDKEKVKLKDEIQKEIEELYSIAKDYISKLTETVDIARKKPKDDVNTWEKTKE